MVRKERPLAGRVVAIPETRELNRLSTLLVEQGATPLSCPLINIRDVADPAPVVAWLRKLSAGDFQDLVLTTGEGVTRLLGFAQRAGMHDETVAALARVRTITRGPKPVRALRQLGLLPTLPAVQPTTDGIIATLSGEPIHGRVIGLQLYGQDPNRKLVDFLEQAGAAVFGVAPYVYLPAADDVEVSRLIQQLAEGSVDAIAFTTRTQVERLFEVAAAHGLQEELERGLRRTLVAAVGPVVVASLADKGVLHAATPERSFFLRPLVEQLREVLADAPRRSG